MTNMNENMMNQSTPSLYKLHFPLLPEVKSVSAQKQFTIFIQGSLVPSISLNPVDIPFMGREIPMEGGGIEFGSWSTSFIIDEEWQSYLLIYNWMMSINNGYNKFGRMDHDYMSEGILTIMNNYEKPIIEFKFKDIWPTSLGEIELDYQEDANHIIANVEFAYNYFVKI